MSGGSRVSIPNSVRRTIQNIKEISGNHTDDEIYAMLKECSMDPNETAQKLLFQDTFHEVRRKRDKKKENLNNRDSADSRWRSGTQRRGGRGGRGDYPSRHVSQDAGGGRDAGFGKDGGAKQGSEKGGTPSILAVAQEMESKAATSVSSSLPVMANGTTDVSNGEPMTCGGTKPLEEKLTDNVNKLINASELPLKTGSFGVTTAREQTTPSSERVTSPASVLGVYSSALDPVLVPSVDSWVPGALGTIKRESRNLQAPVESKSTISAKTISTSSQELADSQVNKVVDYGTNNSKLPSSMNEGGISKIENSFIHVKMSSNQHESSELLSSSAHGGSSISRPSSNYGSRSQQLSGSQKAVGPSKEWKPKPINSNPAPAVSEVTSKVVPVTDHTGPRSLPVLNAVPSNEGTSDLEKKLEKLHFSDTQQVIIPSHLQVSESQKTGLSFGSFNASFGMTNSYAFDPNAKKSSATPSESEEIVEEPSSRDLDVSSDAEGEEYCDNLQSAVDVPENMSPEEAKVSQSAVSEYEQSKPETSSLPLGGPQYSVVHTVPPYSAFGLMPPMVGTQFAPFENTEPQPHDVSRLPGFLVQQPFDPSASYYAPLYRPSADGDGRFSPLLPPTAPTKYNGNGALLPSQSTQSTQELQSGSSLVLSTASPTPHVTQAAGVMHSSIAGTQQPVPVFRQSPALQMSHFPPNYIPYNSYYSPVFLQPPAVHHFLSNTTFPQQPPTGNIYPPPTAAAAGGIKYPQFKSGTNTGNTNHIGMQPGYGQFSTSSAGYSPSPAATTGNSTRNEDLAQAQFKENNAYIAGQQNEGSTVWVHAPGRDIPGMQASSFYNLSPQGQHVTFAPTQAGHAAFPGMYHPTPTMTAATVHPMLQQSQGMAGAVEMVGPQAAVYQQPPQRPQPNWTNNY